MLKDPVISVPSYVHGCAPDSGALSHTNQPNILRNDNIEYAGDNTLGSRNRTLNDPNHTVNTF